MPSHQSPSQSTEQTRAPRRDAPTTDAPEGAMAVQEAPGGGNAAAADAINQANREGRGALNGDPTVGADLGFREADVGDVQGLEYTGPAEARDVAWAVEIHHDESNKLPFDGTPDASQLYTLVEENANESVPGTQTVVSVEGDTQQPYLTQNLVDEPLYINGAPSSADIEQGYVGDCYFLAVVGQLANQDPSRISSDLNAGGGNASFTFKAYDPAGPAWNDEAVSASTELAFSVEDDGALDELHGVGIRANPLPAHSEWWVDYDASTSSMTVMRDDEHEAATWVAYLEKLYMKFVETHGQYGDIQDANSNSNAIVDSNGDQNSGYEIADGGFEHQVYQVFYGSDVVSDRSIDMNFDATDMSNTVVQNKNIIRRLLQLDGQGVGNDRAAMMTAWADSDVHFDRLKTQIDLITGDADSERYRSLRRILVRLSGRIGRWSAEADDAKKDALADKITGSAESLAKPGNWPLLHDPGSDKKWHDLLELASDVQHAGTDSSNGVRNVYSGHAYSVMGATFKDSAGAVMALDPRNLDADLPNIDPQASKVELRNPHHTNEPDMEGNGPLDGNDDGRFDMTLDQFFRNLSGIDIAIVRT
ncbi:MAG: hypothetical protein EP330_07885 [Deltaproteobacteria bacterium]|nr:MAG: hypothetical protein EP330_07885 [Deltaproteobacteria bacterium]